MNSTAHQRLYIRTQLRQRELPTDVVTVMHRDLFRQADVPWRDGFPLDAELCALTKEQAARLADLLRRSA